jgi:phage-related protein
MSFYGRSFMFNNIPSEYLGLYISSSEISTVRNADYSGDTAGSDVKLYTQEIFRRPSPYLYGVQQTPVLSIPVSFTSRGELTAADAQIAARTLFGQQGYGKLWIIQEDMQDIYFNCFFTQPKILKLGNIITGFDSTIICDAPWAWTFPKTLSINYPDDVISTQIIFNNQTDNNFYTYPQLSFTVSNVGGSIQLVNTSDANRTFVISGLSGNEVITFNNDLQIISSSTGLKRLSTFNKQWFRLVRGKNVINLLANINNISMTYSFARKVGG